MPATDQRNLTCRPPRNLTKTSLFLDNSKQKAFHIVSKLQTKVGKDPVFQCISAEEIAMKIDQSAVLLQSQHVGASLHTSKTTLRAWIGLQRPDFEGRSQANQSVAGVSYSLSDVARLRLSKLTLSPLSASKVDSVEQVGDAAQIDPRMRVLMDMILAITGQAVRVFDARELQASPPAAVASPTEVAPSAAPSPAPASQAEPAGWGFELDTHQLVAESETTQVSAQGVVHTADGQQISFTLQIEMSRAFVQDSSSSIRAGDAVRKDPLVINFGGNGVALTDTQFAFDLNSDGQQENIAFVAAGSGFLVLDKNKDGRVNDGTELFGPRSGNGFADLAKYDRDGNEWIDENDAVYSQLKVWQRDASGKDSLRGLAQSGVGALYLGQVASPFSVNSSSNQNLGQVRSTGIFLYESGLVGTLQQVDL